MKESKHFCVWGASRRGELHRQAHICNQDAYTTRIWQGRALGIVADGLGSARLSHIGSHMMCAAAVQFFRYFPNNRQLTVDDLNNLRLDWLSRVPEENIKDYATTCRLVYATDTTVNVSHIGDGGSIVLLKDGPVCLGYDKEASFANLTESICNRKTEWKSFSFPTHEVLAIYLMCDGIYDDICSDKLGAFAQCLHDAFQQKNSRYIHRDMLKTLRVWSGSGDDKTIIGLHRKEHK